MVIILNNVIIAYLSQLILFFWVVWFQIKRHVLYFSLTGFSIYKMIGNRDFKNQSELTDTQTVTSSSQWLLCQVKIKYLQEKSLVWFQWNAVSRENTMFDMCKRQGEITKFPPWNSADFVFTKLCLIMWVFREIRLI